MAAEKIIDYISGASVEAKPEEVEAVQPFAKQLDMFNKEPSALSLEYLKIFYNVLTKKGVLKNKGFTKYRFVF